MFQGVDLSKTFVNSREAKDGYVPMLHVQVCMRFGPDGEPSLFAPDEYGAVVSATDIKQGALGDCYLLGAMMILAENQVRLAV